MGRGFRDSQVLLRIHTLLADGEAKGHGGEVVGGRGWGGCGVEG
jgi:hypothetical protein